MLSSFDAASTSDNNCTNPISANNRNIPFSAFTRQDIQNNDDVKLDPAESQGNSEEDDETVIASQAPSLTPRQLPSLTTLGD